MAVTQPRVSAKASIGGSRALFTCDRDQIALSSVTGISATTDEDSGVPTTLKSLVAAGAVIKVNVRVAETGTSKVFTSPIYIAADEIGKGAITKLQNRPYKDGIIRSAKIKQTAISG